MNALSHLTVLPTTASERRTFAEMAVNEMIAERHPLEMAVMLSSLEKLVSDIRKNARVQNWLANELNKHQSGRAEVNGVNVELTERKKYDFATCQDVEWEQLDAQIQALTEAKKRREIFLRYIQSGGVVDPVTGAMIYPPHVEVSNVITVTERRAK